MASFSGSDSEGNAGAGVASKGAAPLATIKVKAGAASGRNTEDNEGAGGADLLGTGVEYAPVYTSSPGAGEGDDGTPRHGDESPLLAKHRATGGSSRAGRRTGEGAGAGGEGKPNAPLSPRALPPSSTFVSDARVEQWIAGSESSFDKQSLIKHISVSWGGAVHCDVM